MASRLFLKNDLEQIEAHIKQFESKTNGQIVVMTAMKSDPYTSVPLRFGVMGIVISSLVFLLLSKTLFWLPQYYLFIFQFFGFLSFFLFGSTQFALLYFVPDWILTLRVRKAALAAFVEKGVHETENNTGILIYLSEAEHHVEILADTKAFNLLTKEGLAIHATAIINGIKSKNAVKALCESIDDLSNQLQKHFPKTGQNKNELSDEVRVE